MSRDQRAIFDIDEIAGAASFEQHVMIAGSNEGASTQNSVVGFGFLDGDFAEAVEALGEGSGKHFRHVLDDHDARSVRRKTFEKNLEGFGSTGGSSDGDDFFGSLNHRARCARENGIGREFRFDLVTCEWVMQGLSRAAAAAP